MPGLTSTKTLPLMTVRVTREPDIVTARQRARQIAGLLGFQRQDQVRIATAVSEIARNAWRYASGADVEFLLEMGTSPRQLRVRVLDRGPGIQHLNAVLDGSYESATGAGLGIVGARRLMDEFHIESRPGAGTTVTLSRYLPKTAQIPDDSLAHLSARLAAGKPAEPLDEIEEQNRELLRALDAVRNRELDLERLNQELEDTNRGVVALYAELDEKAVSLVRADQLKSRFLSHMSHEFRTPLNSILALARILESRVDGDLTVEQSRQIGYIQRAAEELAEMVNDLLDLAKVEAGKAVLNVSEIAVSKVFGTLRGMLRPLQVNDSVSLIFEEPSPDITLRTDEGKIAQVLRNLVSNALKFTERGEVHVSVSESENAFCFKVRDTGIGIPLEAQELIFQEFAQVQHPLQRKVRGTGLGLPLSRKLAELLGGSLTVQSAAGEGSTFVFTLPLTTVISPRRPAPTASADAGVAGAGEFNGSDTVLVIDDDEVTRYLVRQLLRDTRFQVTEADCGSVGIERARFDQPRGILLDLNMPGTNGFEVLEELRSYPETEHTPVLIYTSRKLTENERQRLNGYGVAILSKENLAAAQFLKTVEDTFGGAREGTGREH